MISLSRMIPALEDTSLKAIFMKVPNYIIKLTSSVSIAEKIAGVTLAP